MDIRLKMWATDNEGSLPKWICLWVQPEEVQSVKGGTKCIQPTYHLGCNFVACVYSIYHELLKNITRHSVRSNKLAKPIFELDMFREQLFVFPSVRATDRGETGVDQDPTAFF